jgi:L-alanine-DL-glutamate epimerase-like enolase superfamily enzyme
MNAQGEVEHAEGRAKDLPSIEALEAAAAAPVLTLNGLADEPVIIESITLQKKGSEYYVHARSQAGVEGLAFTNGRAQYYHPILNQLIIPYFIGKDARDLEQLLVGVYRHSSNYKMLGQALWCPVAWVELALLDLLGRTHGKSIATILGGAVRERVPFYVASGRRDSTPQEEVSYLQILVDETGARSVKFRIGGRMSANADASPGRTETLIALARQPLGDGIDLHADANSSYDPPQAIEVGRRLEDVGAVYFEEPCPFDHLEDTKLVADALTIPVSGGEQESSQRRFRWMIANRGVDIVQPDIHYYGGFIRSIRVARMAGMSTTVHISGGFDFVYMLIFAAVTTDIGAYQEYKRGIEERAQWFEPALGIRDGSLCVPGGPGTGVADIRGFIDGSATVG